MRALVNTQSEVCLILEGFRALQATNRAEVLVLVERLNGPLDLIVSDVHMPGGDGVELAHAVAKFYPWIPVIRVSGCPDHSVTSAAEFVQKPFLPPTLVEAVRRVSFEANGRISVVRDWAFSPPT